MRGRKPTLNNVIPLKGSAPREKPADLAKRLCPRGLSGAERREWMRVGTILAEPTLDRLKPHFVDLLGEYCRLTLRLREFRAKYKTLEDEVYENTGRHGFNVKSHPDRAQWNDDWRKWNSLRMELGLGPASERNMTPGQGNLFDDPAGEFYA